MSHLKNARVSWILVLVVDVLSFRAGEAANLAGTILLPLLLRSDMRFPEDEGRILTSVFALIARPFRQSEVVSSDCAEGCKAAIGPIKASSLCFNRRNKAWTR